MHEGKKLFKDTNGEVVGCRRKGLLRSLRPVEKWLESVDTSAR